MACGNCTSCGDSSKGASQRSYVAYIQPCGASPSNDALNAMVDGGYGSSIKVTGGQRQIRGSRTAKRKRTSDGASTLCYYTESSPGENTVSLEFASCGCGGYSPEELAAEGTFDLYQMQACCGSADMAGGWSKMHVMRCISFNSLSFGDQTSYDPDDDNDLVHTFDANYVEDYYLYPLTMSEIGSSGGTDVGSRIDSLVFPGKAKGCKKSCQDDCAGNWYALTNEGKITYRLGSNSAIQEVVIPAFVATPSARIGIIGDKLFVVIAGGFYTSTVNEYGVPGTWTYTAAPSILSPDFVFSDTDKIYVYGNGGIKSIDYNGTVTSVLTTASAVVGYDTCGGKSAAILSNGAAYIGSSCGTISPTAVAPTAAAGAAVAIRPGGDVWIVTATGVVRYTTDDGETWNTVTLPGNPTHLRDIKWVDSGVGYIASEAPPALYSTEDGGNTWSKNGADSRIGAIAGMASPLSINVPCCTNKSKTMNSIIVTGITSSGTGGIWQSSISSCS